MFPHPTPRPSQRPQTNPQFTHFRQEHFTAGTEEQFLKCTEELDPLRISPYHTQGEQVPRLFQQIDSTAKIGTFHYLFYGFKKGIFIRIRRGRVVVFLPFSNADYKNEWHTRIRGEEWCAHFQAPIDRWYANNYLFRHEWPINEGDTGVAALKHMFESVCAEREINDVDVFVNKRDFPILREDLCEPYDAIYGPNQPIANPRTNYLPMLSMVRAPGFADIAIPTSEDWTRICAQHDPPGFFFSSKREQHIVRSSPLRWNDKIPQVVFRGSSTGRGQGLDNLRIQLVAMVQGDPRFNVGITSLSDRWQIVGGQLVPPAPRGTFPTVAFMPPEEQRKYKFIIHINGHVRGFRLSHEFSYGSVILLVDGPYHLWFEKYLVDGVHYVGVASDLSNLMEKVDWCFRNDARAAEIARAAESFFYTHLSREAALNELATTLNTVAIHARPQQNYLYSSPAQPPHATQIQAVMSRLLLPNFAPIPRAAMTVARYLKSYEFIPSDWEAIMGQIRLALMTAQRYVRFTHHALTPETAWLYDLDRLKTVDYILGENQVARITTRRIVLFSHFEDAYVEGIRKIRGFNPECDLKSFTCAATDLISRFQLRHANQLGRGWTWDIVPFAEYVDAPPVADPSSLAHSLLRRYEQQRRFCNETSVGACILQEEPWFYPRGIGERHARLIWCALEDMLTFGGVCALDEREREHVKHILRSINA